MSSDPSARTAVDELLKEPRGSFVFNPAALEFFLYAAAEWRSRSALERLREELDGVSASVSKNDFGDGGQDVRPGQIRVLCDAGAFFKNESWLQAASSLIELFERRWDQDLGAFAGEGDPRLYRSGENARIVRAYLSAWPRLKKPEMRLKAEKALDFIQNRLYDPLLGLVHRWPAAAALEYGFLSDCAQTALALTESYLQNGKKPRRDFADSLAKYLFQELWERERGGFFSRAGAEGEALDAQANAAAFEALWRLRYQKGNNAYAKWVEIGLGRFLGGEKTMGKSFPLLKIKDMLSRGRLELELVGRMDDPGSQAILEALAAFYSPRKIVSFIDPDDQDYVLAHGLAAPSYPRLFGCVGLKPRAATADPAGLAGVLEAISGIS